MADETRPPETHADAAEDSFEAPRPALGRITRVRLKNYKSIVSCDVQLEPLTLLVGPNGSGKSNFLDALAFVSEALTVGLDQAILKRSNLDRMLSAAREPDDDSFSIHLDFVLSTGEAGSYSFEIGRADDVGFEVRREALEVNGMGLPGGGKWLFAVTSDGASMWASDEVASKFPPNRNQLFFKTYSAFEYGRPAFDLLSNMVFYNPQPDTMRDVKRQDTWPHLHSDGRNVASMLLRMQAADPELIWGLTQYMKRILPGLESIHVEDLAGRGLLHLTMIITNGDVPVKFAADQMSDGTLRALAVLVALFQGRLGGKSAPSLVGIEEPENTIHPYAARILLAAMQSASRHTQVLATTHSADMLHMGDADLRSVLVVSAEDGLTRIGPIDAVSQGIVRDNIYTLGELLQMDQLFPEPPTQAANGDAAAHQPVGGGI